MKMTLISPAYNIFGHILLSAHIIAVNHYQIEPGYVPELSICVVKMKTKIKLLPLTEIPLSMCFRVY